MKNTTKILNNSKEEFYCERCDYKCFRKSDFKKHIDSRKHNTTPTTKKQQPIYSCICGKEYNHRASLFNHRKKCTHQDAVVLEEEIQPMPNVQANIQATNKLDPELMKGLLMQNQELIKEIIKRDELLDKKDELMEQMINKIGTTNNITNNNNTQNNHFNISVFLNEECKNAINFSEFIDRIEVSHEDLENNAELGFVNGISKILMDNLKQLTVHERPIHCTDVKRETMYIKDDNEWQKEKQTTTQKLNDAIQEVSRRSMISLMDWKKTNPDYIDGDSEFSTKCIAMQQQSIAITKKEQYYPKVVHKIAKESAIDKTIMKNQDDE